MSDPQATQSVADLVRREMFANDRASKTLGMEIVAMGPGTAQVRMIVQSFMLNGFDLCHGGFITALADSAFAFACNSYNEMAVAAGASVEFLAPARAGDVLTAGASEVALNGRSGVYDVIVTRQDGAPIATFRGRSHRVKGKPSVPKSAAPTASHF